jgi:dipeptidyl aminopeptidase/acylaminoacyl peptidase
MMNGRSARVVVLILLIGIAPLAAHGQTPPASGYLTPPQVVVDILDAPPLPGVAVSPARDTIALLERTSMPSIAELAQPMLRLAGMRINPRTNGLHRTGGIVGIRFTRVADGREVRVSLPPDAIVEDGRFSPDGTRYAFTLARPSGLELWIAETASGRARAVTAAPLNGVGAAPCVWGPDAVALLCRFVPEQRGPAPAPPAVPAGPNIQENRGRAAPVPTFQDLLETAHDEALFEHYYASQLAFVDAASGRRTPVGRPGMFDAADLSPDGEFILVARLKRPFSRLVPSGRFPRDVEVWTRRGDVARRIADLPLAQAVPILGVPTGPRGYRWNPTEPATLVWIEALDEGDLRNDVPHRDRLLSLRAPFAAEPAEFARLAHRFAGISWTERGTALVTESERTKRRVVTWILQPPAAPRKLWDRGQQDAYANPGNPVFKSVRGEQVIGQQGDWIYLSGPGSSPTGDRPFLDRLNLSTLVTERLFQSAADRYETLVGLLTDDGQSILTRHESRIEPPNYFARSVADGTRRALTDFRDPAPQLAGIQKQLITYTRDDGVALSGTLYLPPDYRQGERLPLLLWAYPREFVDPDAAGQVTGSPNRFTTIGGPSHLLFLLQGYAVLDDPAMPVVGPGETANDTYVDQLVASARAAIDKVVEMGVADRNRILVGGHSYGAFMTANLLAHSDLFRAGIARSGAYNRTLTPFGFQSERRTFWEVPEIYGRMSPFFHADKINEPVLLLHGEADNNSGTFPIQSERFYMALKGQGATVRYVTLPHESHGYAARESVLHTVAEMLNWADEHVKNAGPPARTSATAR